MDDMKNIDGVYFDFGGVISVSPMPKWEKTLYPYCESVGLSRRAAIDGFARFRSLWDSGETTFEDLYRHIFRVNALPEPSAEVLAEIRRLDAASWVDELRPDTLALMGELKAEGKKIGILSNMAPDFYDDYFKSACAGYIALADVEIISGFVRLCKPDPAIYALAAERIGIAPARLMFYDDFESNVEAARKCGWQAQVYPPYR